MNKYIHINSQLDALKVKETEKTFYNYIDNNAKVIPKVTPFKGINTDLMYIKDNKVLFIKFMDTTEDLFTILEEELLEVMKEEYDLLKIKMNQFQKNINYEYLFIMPYVDIDNSFGFQDFVNNNIIDKKGLKNLSQDKYKLDNYLRDANNEVELNLFLLYACPEYYVISDNFHYNKDFKKITFFNDEYQYCANIIDRDQYEYALSINYGDTVFDGGSGTGKTTILLSRAIKLSRVYPHHKFIIFTHSKQLTTELKEKIDLLYKENQNIEVHTFKSFIFKLAKKYNLILDYNMLKNDYEKVFNNLIKQAQNIIKNKNIFKGIFIDEIESFSSKEIDFIKEFLYKSKYIFNSSCCDTLNIYNNFNINKLTKQKINFNNRISLNKNYRQVNELVSFVNNFSSNSNEYIKSIRPNTSELFMQTDFLREGSKRLNIIKVSDLDEQIKSILWEIEYFVKKLGLKYSDIAIVYPFNKKKLKSGKTIYFQYMMKKALEESEISYILAEDELTNTSKKSGITLSNIYNIKNLENKCIILCELEMLYNQTINDKEQDYQVNDFVGDLNKVYLAISKATDYLSIITTFNEEASEIINLLMKSKI